MILKFLVAVGITVGVSGCGFGAALAEDEEKIAGSSAGNSVASRLYIEPTPNGYGYYIHGCAFHQRAAALIFEHAAQHPKTPLKIYEPGAGKGSFLTELLGNSKNKQYPLIYHASDLHEAVYPVLDEVIATHSKNPLNKFGKAKAGRGDMGVFLKGKDQAYDVIAPFMMLHFLMPWQLPVTLIQVHRSLKPDGLFVGTVTLVQEQSLKDLYFKEGEGTWWPSFWGFVGQLRKNGAFIKEESTRGDRQGIHSLFMHYFIKEQWRDLLTAFGFEVSLCEEDMEAGILCFAAQKKGETSLNLNRVQFDSIREGIALQELLLQELDKQDIPVPPGWREKPSEFLFKP